MKDEDLWLNRERCCWLGALLLQQQVPGSETCSFMQPDGPGFGTCSFVQSSVPNSEHATALQPEAVSRLLGPPDGSRVANLKPQDASKNPPSETSECCTFLARSGGLAEHGPNRKWWILHWFYNVF